MDITYTSHTCKNCNTSFMDEDKIDSFVLAPDYKYCNACVKKGFKNNKPDREYARIINKIEELIYSNGTGQYPNKDEIWLLDKCKKTIEEYIKFGRVIKAKSIYNQAKEVLGYIKEENNNG